MRGARLLARERKTPRRDVALMSDDPNRSVAVWDLAPDDGGAPNQLQALAWRATELIDAWPLRYRLVRDGDQAPTERSDGKPIDPGLK